MLRKVGSLLWVLCGAVIIVLFCRSFVCMLFTVPTADKEPFFKQGDRVLVDRWSYGFRAPFSTRFGYHKWGKGFPQNGDWAVFNYPLVHHSELPDTSALCLGQVMASPGDTIWMGREGKVGRCRDYVRGHIWPIPVPAKGAYIQVMPWANRIYRMTMEMHEAEAVDLMPSDSFEAIQEGGNTCVRFSRNYYWISSGSEENVFDSRTFGFVPEEFFMGKARCVLYSIQPAKEWKEAWRKDRFCSPL